MSLDELKRTWKKKSDSNIQAGMWDSKADIFFKKPVPKIDEDRFLTIMAEKISFNNEIKVLDVGCGTGDYSMALAPFVKEATGTDVSPRMIDFAKKKAEQLNIENVHFHTVSWRDADIDALGYRNAFDVAFAHMTPAVEDYETLDKLNECARRICMIEKPVRRITTQDIIYKKLGIEIGDDENTMITNIFAYLWNKGYEPEVFYQHDVWEFERSADEMIKWCIDNVRLKKSISKEEESIIAQVVEAQAVNGMVKEITKPTRITMVWNKENVWNG